MFILLFTADALLIAVTAWIGVCAAGLTKKGLLESSLGWILLGLSWIVFSGVLLGMIGGLGRDGFLIFHAVGLAGLLSVRRKWKNDAQQWAAWLTDWGRFLRSGTPESWMIILLILVVSFLAVLAARAEPSIFDAMTYRLPRIGQWLQDGRIASSQTDDPRLNYMPVGPDLIIAWLLGATNAGFHLAPLSQLAGGVLLLGATFGLGRLAGLGRRGSLGAIALVLGMANVAVQFTTVQSDLFTAGAFSASYVLWHSAWNRRESSWVAGIGLGLAWGSKGTLFYLAPGAALWIAWLIYRHGWSWQTWRPILIATILGLTVFVGPSYYRNLRDYNSFFGPRDAVLLHHGGPLTVRQHLKKLGLNLETSTIQLFDPTAQPIWFQQAAASGGKKLLPLLPMQDDPYLFSHGTSRRILAGSALYQAGPDADVLSCGLVAVVIFLFGALVAGWRRASNPMAVQILVWAAGVAIYILVQHALVQWHPWAFRFMVLVAPWIAVVGAWGICQVTRKVQLVLWVVIVASTAQLFTFVQLRAYQAAWQVVTKPGSSMATILYSHWRTWAGKLDRPEAPLRLAFPINYAEGVFYRLNKPRRATLERFSDLNGLSAEAATTKTSDWLIVPAFTFKGREGRVFGKTWLFKGEEDSAYSVAGYRALRPGESPVPILYHSSTSLKNDGIQCRLLIRSWQASVALHLKNPSGSSWKFDVATGSIHRSGDLQAYEEIPLEIPIRTGAPSDVTFDFHSSTPTQNANLYPTVDLADE
jgi:hypothetical protein